MGIVLFDDAKNTASNKTFIPKRMADFINKGTTHMSSNFPNLQLPRIDHAHRLIHIHQNVPGIMAQVNKILARHQVNIVAQFLMTNAQIGYVITDINAQYDKALLKDLKKIENTLKFRVLY
jgi:D-3-phosphoglycerate dehydrogenase / 2-oxoglutarate reductase